MTTKIDPITVEVLRNGFVAAADEMKINLMRTAYNPIIYEVLDFSVGLFDENGENISQAVGLPIFLGNLGPSVQQIMKDVGVENMQPGDIYLINDTFTVGTHLNDVVVCNPIFMPDGKTLVGFGASRSHWLDIGAVSPGGWTTDTTEIFQEGIRLRSIQLYKAGEPVRDIFRILEDNVRFSDSVMGDLRAQIAAGRTGERRMLELVERYGLDTVRAAIQEMYRMEEAAARAAVAEMPDGVYEAESFMDDDGVAIDRPKVKVTVTIKGDEMTVDLTGSAEQCVGPINCGWAATLSAVKIAFKAVTSPLTEVNEGSFRPLRLVVPDNSVFNVQYPGPSAIYGVITMTLADTVFRALQPAIPDRIPAAHYADVAPLFVFGTDPRNGQPYLAVEPNGGGWGATPFRDGENMLIALADGDTRNVPIEVLENRFPLRCEQYSVRPDSGGAGYYRGGLGQIRTYRILDHDAHITTSQERSKCLPWGFEGGGEGYGNRVVIDPGLESETIIQKCTNRPVKANSLVSVQTGGGGGYGDPLKRAPEKVQLDVVRGYVSVAAAAEKYGVVIDPETLAVDVEATAARREQMRQAAN